MAAQVQRSVSILRRRKVEARVGLSRSTLYAQIASGAFPAPIRLGPRCVGWVEAEVDDWLAAQIERSRKSASKP